MTQNILLRIFLTLTLVLTQLGVRAQGDIIPYVKYFAEGRVKFEMKIIGESIEMKASVPLSSWFGIGFHD